MMILLLTPIFLFVWRGSHKELILSKSRSFKQSRGDFSWSQEFLSTSNVCRLCVRVNMFWFQKPLLTESPTVAGMTHSGERWLAAGLFPQERWSLKIQNSVRVLRGNEQKTQWRNKGDRVRADGDTKGLVTGEHDSEGGEADYPQKVSDAKGWAWD